jgi:MFS family permease
VWQVGVLRAGAWAARGLRVPARDALLADVVPASAYGRAYRFERMMDNLGAIFGPLLALGLVAVLGVRWAIGLSVIPGCSPQSRSFTPSATPLQPNTAITCPCVSGSAPA